MNDTAIITNQAVLNGDSDKPVRMSVAVDFTLLNTSLSATLEVDGDERKELLIQPQYQYDPQPFALEQLVAGINNLFSGLIGGEDYFDSKTIEEQLGNFLEETSLSTLQIAIQQVFVHVTKLKDSPAEIEYAFSLKITSGKAVPKDFTFASLESISFGIWNTDNRRILSNMGLLSIAQQLG